MKYNIFNKIFIVLLSGLIFCLVVRPAQAATEQQKQAAIDAGLAWLAGIQQADGHWEFGDTRSDLAATSSAVLAFIEEEYLPNDGSIYGTNVANAINFILNGAQTVALSAETAVYWRHAEDYNNSGAIEAGEGNGQAIQFHSNDIYSNGITAPVIFALGQRLGENTVIGGTSPVAGMTYAQLMQDIIDWFSWGQVEPNTGNYRGGWRYYPNYSSSDNSTAQWGSLPMLYAASWGLMVPQYVKDELELWVNYIQNANGGSGYDNPNNLVNVAKTGGLLLELAVIGAASDDQRVVDALDFINSRWNNGASGTWYGNLNHPYAMWAVYKALGVWGFTMPYGAGPDEQFPIGFGISSAPGGFTIGQDWWDPLATSLPGDWFSHYCDYLVSIQNANGSWAGYSYWYGALATGWYINILNATGSPPPSNEPPDCSGASIPDQSADANCQATISGADVSGVTDPDGDDLTITVDPTALILGENTVTVTADDGNGGTCSTDITVNVVDDTDPVITCPADIPVDNDPGQCNAIVEFEVTAADNCDSDVDIVCVPASGSTFPVGETTVNCTATDDAGNEAECSFKVTVEDNEAPVITTVSDPVELWPPNHKYVTIDASECVVSVSDNCNTVLSASDVYITSVSSDEEEDAQGNGDGKTLNDIVIAQDCQSVQLRRERQGGGNGRVYTINLSVDDGNGNSGTATCQVTVPHSQNGDPAVDDGAGEGYIVDGGCGSTAPANIAITGTGEETSHPESTPSIPNNFMLEQNYPNPFNPTTTISYTLPKDSRVVLKIYNSIGQEITTLVKDQRPAGEHQVQWQPQDLPSGVYIISFTAGDYHQIRKMLYMK